MYFIDLNYLAIIVAALIPLLLGSFWYSPVAFGNQWLMLSNIGKENTPQSRREIVLAFLGSFAAGFVMSLVLAVLIRNLLVFSAVDGMEVGFWVWLGFVASTMLPEYLFGGSAKPYQLYALTAGYHLLSLVVMGALLAMWL
ncbi:MAG: DUF1761 domain-containing protein [Candidatus Paceibacterota bacterium]